MSDRHSSLIPTVIRLLRPFWPVTLVCTLAGTASGLATASLLAAINTNLHSDSGITRQLVLLFIVLFLITLIGEIVSDIGNTLVGQRIIAGLRNELSAKILRAPIIEIEHYQPHRMLTALNQDLSTISNLTFGFSGFAIALAVTLGCFVYMFWLSPSMFLITLAALALGSLGTAYARASGIKGFARTREAEDDLQKHYRSIIEGAKELRMDRNRRIDVYRNKIQGATQRIVQAFMSGVVVFCSANAFGSALYFFVIGILLLMQSGVSEMQRTTISGFVITLLYMRGPLTQIVGQLPTFARAQIAMRRLADLATRFSTPEPGLLDDAPAPPDPAKPGAFSLLEMQGVCFTFPQRNADSAFALGPIDLRIQAGEILFVTGENGGGKTTLIKLLLGLYTPTSGEIRMNGVPLAAEDMDRYRQSFATVFSDYFLFEEINLPSNRMRDEVDRYLKRLELAHKVSIQDGRYSDTDLSTGQRKRLALIQAWVEGRPILVLDEWAADQDPEFRLVFYTEILPMLKSQGRTVIAISHDDRYFHVADRRITLRGGEIVELVDNRTAQPRPRITA